MSADLVRSLGLGALYTREQRAWSVSPWTFGIQADYSLYLQDLVYQQIRLLERRGIITPAEADKQKKQVPVDAAAGEYSFGNEYVMGTFQNSRENLGYLFWLMVAAKDKDFTLDLARRCVVEDVDGVVAAISGANANPENPDPNPTTPVTPGVSQ